MSTNPPVAQEQQFQFGEVHPVQDDGELCRICLRACCFGRLGADGPEILMGSCEENVARGHYVFQGR